MSSNILVAIFRYFKVREFITAIAVTEVSEDAKKTEKLKELLKHANIQPKQVVFIGDTSSDMQAADKVGIPGIRLGKFAAPEATEGNPWAITTSLEVLKVLYQFIIRNNPINQSQNSETTVAGTSKNVAENEEKLSARTSREQNTYPLAVPEDIHWKLVSKYGERDLVKVKFVKEGVEWRSQTEWHIKEIEEDLLTDFLNSARVKRVCNFIYAGLSKSNR
jgi:hypothetical protein